MDELVVSRRVEIPLTPDDRAEVAQQLSAAIEELAFLNSQKKAVMADVNGDIKQAEAKVLELNGTFRAGFRVQNIACRVLYHEPSPNWKRYVDVGTAEPVGADERMSVEEINAHSQLAFGDPDDERKRSRRQ